MIFKEFFNENKTWIISAVAGFLLGIATISAICIPVYNRKLGQANRKVGELTVELSESYNRLSDAAVSIINCREAVGRISESVSESGEELTDIIRCLRTVREEVRVMEDSFNSFDINSSSLSDINNNMGDMPE